MARVTGAMWRTTALALPFIAVLLVHAGQYSPFLSDDALISLRYARRLLDGHGLTWTDGHPVEGYSNLLWILAVAALGRVGVDLIDAARALGLAGMAGVLLTLAFVFGRRPLRRAWFSVAVPLLFVALSAPIAVWAIGGLEQPLVALLLAGSMALAAPVLDREHPVPRRALAVTMPLGLLCLTRPDGALLAGVSVTWILLSGVLGRRPGPIQHAALAATGPVVAVGGQLVFRLAYYGEWVPNTALVKIAGSATHRAFGLEYLASAGWAHVPWSVVAPVAATVLLVRRDTRARAGHASLLAAVWLLYVVPIGGDVFPAYRHLVPAIVCAAFLLGEVAVLVAHAPGLRPAAFGLAVAVTFAAFVPFVRAQAGDKWNRRATTERWEWQARDLGLALKQAFGDRRPVLAVTAAGSLPYWSELPSLDMMGLNDYYLPRHRPPDFGQGMVGHELGNGRYVLDRAPDLIVFDIGSPEPSWRTGRELAVLPEFHARYVAMALRPRPQDPIAIVFVHRYSERVGIAREGSRLVVPAYLLTGEGVVATLSGPDGLMVEVPPGADARLVLSVDDARGWQPDTTGVTDAVIAVAPDAGGLVLSVRATGTEPARLQRIVLVRE